MRHLEVIPGLLVLALRLACVPVSGWALDGIAALAVFWIALGLTREQTRSRNWSIAIVCVWLGLIYAWHQGPLMLAGWR